MKIKNRVAGAFLFLVMLFVLVFFSMTIVSWCSAQAPTAPTLTVVTTVKDWTPWQIQVADCYKKVWGDRATEKGRDYYVWSYGGQPDYGKVNGVPDPNLTYLTKCLTSDLIWAIKHNNPYGYRIPNSSWGRELPPEWQYPRVTK